MSFWGVAMCKANSEGLAQHHLERQGFDVYLPRFLSRIGKETKIKVLFPRYLFVKIILQWHCINGTRGISRLLMNESSPAVVPDKIIENLMRRQDSNGLINLPDPPKFKSGERVRVVNPSMVGYTAIYQGMKDSERARVLIEMLGRLVQVDLPERELELIGPAVASDTKINEINTLKSE